MGNVGGLPNKKIYTFGSHQNSRIGQINIRIPISHSYFLSLDAAVVDESVTLLMEIDVLTYNPMIINNADDEVKYKQDGWRIQVFRQSGHVYLEWTVGISYTDSEIRKIHNHLYHPQYEKLRHDASS